MRTLGIVCDRSIDISSVASGYSIAHPVVGRHPGKSVRAGLTAGGSRIRTIGTSRKEPLSLSLFGGFGPEVSRLCLCDSLPARSVRSQFRRDRRCYTEGAPLR